MNHLNSRQRKRIYRILVERDSEKCNLCGKTPRLHQVKLVVDRIDNNDPEYTGEKTQLLCKSCNRKKDPRKKTKRTLDVCVGVCTKKITENEHPTEIEINRDKEPKFREYVKKRVEKEPDDPSYEDVKYGGAELLKFSARAAGTYLRKLCSSEGSYDKVDSNDGFVIKKKRKIKSRK